MASSKAAADPQVIALKTALYDTCAEESNGAVFRQHDLLDMGVIPGNDINMLLKVMQRLCNENLFKMATDGDGLLWKLQKVEDAERYALLYEAGHGVQVG